MAVGPATWTLLHLHTSTRPAPLPGPCPHLRAAETVDSAVAAWFSTYLSCPVTAELINYLAIPLAEGGLSLRTMVAASPAALLGAFVDARQCALMSRPHLAPAFDYPELDDPRQATIVDPAAAQPTIVSDMLHAYATLQDLDDPPPAPGQHDTRVLRVLLPSLGPAGIAEGAAARAEKAKAARPAEETREPFAPGGTQAKLSRIPDKANFARVVVSMTQRQRANLHSCASTAASAYINTLPSPLSANFKKAKRTVDACDPNTIIGDSWCNLSNAQLQVALQSRFSIPLTALRRPDLPPLDTCPRQGQGGQSCPAAADEFGDHSRSCGHGPDRTHRHDILVGALASILASASSAANVSTDRHAILAAVSRPPPGPEEPERPCPDIIRYGSPPTYYDVTVVCPTLPSQLAAGSANTPGKSAALKERAKLNHYAGIIGPGRPIALNRLIPAVLESGGRLGNALTTAIRTSALLKVGADPTADRLTPAAAAFYRLFTQQLSVTLQKLQADMVLSDARDHYTRVAAPPTSADRQAFAGLPRDFTAADAFLATL